MSWSQNEDKGYRGILVISSELSAEERRAHAAGEERRRQEQLSREASDRQRASDAATHRNDARRTEYIKQMFADGAPATGHVSVTHGPYGNACPGSETAHTYDAEPFSWRPLITFTKWCGRIGLGFLSALGLLRAVCFVYDECPWLYQYPSATFLIAVSANILLYVDLKRERPGVRALTEEWVRRGFLRATKPKFRSKAVARVLAGLLLVTLILGYLSYANRKPMVDRGIINIDATAFRGGTDGSSHASGKGGRSYEATEVAKAGAPHRRGGRSKTEPSAVAVHAAANCND